MGRQAEDPEEVKARGGRTNASQKKGIELNPSFPKMPKDLSELSKPFWIDLLNRYAFSGIIVELDIYALTVFCDRLAMRKFWVDIRDQFIKDGVPLSYQTSNECWTVKPCVNEVRKCNAEIDSSLRVLGATPLARQSIKPGDTGKKKSTRSSMKKNR